MCLDRTLDPLMTRSQLDELSHYLAQRIGSLTPTEGCEYADLLGTEQLRP